MLGTDSVLHMALKGGLVTSLMLIRVSVSRSGLRNVALNRTDATWPHVVLTLSVQDGLVMIEPDNGDSRVRHDVSSPEPLMRRDEDSSNARKYEKNFVIDFSS